MVTKSGKGATSIDAVEHAKLMEKKGAGEIIINSIDRDGTQSGYDLELVNLISGSVGVPVIASGGAGEHKHFIEVKNKANASAATAGSYFVFHGPLNAVLISYPSHKKTL